MPSTYSSLLRLEMIGSGEQAGIWGNTTNQNLGTLLEQAIAGSATVTLTSTANYLLSARNGTSDEQRSAILNITGTPGGPTNIIVPASQKLWVVRNACGATVTMKTATQTGGAVIADGASMLVFCDGTNVYAGMRKVSLAEGGTGGTDAPSARAALDVPSRAGVGATGTWGIDISGNAASATVAGSVPGMLTAADTSASGGANKLLRYDANGNLGLGRSTKGNWQHTGSTPFGCNWGAEFGALGALFSRNWVITGDYASTYNHAGIMFNGYVDQNTVKNKNGDNANGGGVSAVALAGARVDFMFSTTRPTLADTAVTLQVYGSATQAGYVTSSDVRLKTDLTRVGRALDKVQGLTGYTYRRTDMDDPVRHLGLLAQDVQKVMPEAVHVGEDGYLSVNYGSLVALLVESIKELRAEVAELRQGKE